MAAEDSLSTVIDVVLRRGQGANTQDEVKSFVEKLDRVEVDSTLNHWLDGE